MSRLAASEGTSKPLPKINDRPSPTERGPRTPFERLPGLALGGEALPDSGAGLATSAYQAYLRICTRIRFLNFRDCHNAQWYRGPMSQSSESDPTYVSYTRGGGPKIDFSVNKSMETAGLSVTPDVTLVGSPSTSALASPRAAMPRVLL